MFKQNFLNGNKEEQINAYSKPESISNRRSSKMLVELSIGIIGLIAVMLAQIASHQSNQELKRQVSSHDSVVYQLSDNIADKVASLTEVSPMATQVNWLNILF